MKVIFRNLFLRILRSCKVDSFKIGKVEELDELFFIYKGGFFVLFFF